jgi:hypothetical protein
MVRLERRDKSRAWPQRGRAFFFLAAFFFVGLALGRGISAVSFAANKPTMASSVCSGMWMFPALGKVSPFSILAHPPAAVALHCRAAQTEADAWQQNS